MRHTRITLNQDNTANVVGPREIKHGECIDCGDATKTGHTLGIPWANTLCSWCRAIRRELGL